MSRARDRAWADSLATLALSGRRRAPQAEASFALGGETVVLSCDDPGLVASLADLLWPFMAVHTGGADDAEVTMPSSWHIVVHQGVPTGARPALEWSALRVYGGEQAWSCVVDGKQLVVRPKKRDELTICDPAARRIEYWFDQTPDLGHLGHLVKMPIRAGLRRAGWLGLHASVVEVDGRAWAFVGDKGVGKTSLLLALIDAGARYVANDTAYVRLAEPGPIVHGWPNMIRIGMETLAIRGLWPDASSLEALAQRPAGEVRLAGDGKIEFYAKDFASVLHRPVAIQVTARLSGLFFLERGPSAMLERVAPEPARRRINDVLRRQAPGVAWLEMEEPDPATLERWDVDTHVLSGDPESTDDRARLIGIDE